MIIRVAILCLALAGCKPAPAACTTTDDLFDPDARPAACPPYGGQLHLDPNGNQVELVGK